MIEIALQPAKEIIEGLSWTERYGGLARPTPISIDEGVKKIFPVRQGLSNDQCFQQKRYTDLVPNSNFLNLLYFESISDFTQQKGGSSRDMLFSGRIRLVFWLNLKKMGKLDGGLQFTSGHAAAHLMRALCKRMVVTNPFSGSVEYMKFSVVPTSPEIFSKYSYGDDVAALMHYPFDFGAIEFDVALMYGKNCVPDLGLEAEIKCIQWN